MVVWQGITSGGTAVPVQVTESGEVVAATNTPVPGPQGPPGAPGKDGNPGPPGAPGKDGDQWIEVNSRLIKPTNNVGISVLLDAEFSSSVKANNSVNIGAFDSTSAVSEGVDITKAGEFYIQAASSKAHTFDVLRGYYGTSNTWSVKANGSISAANDKFTVNGDGTASVYGTSGSTSAFSTYNGGSNTAWIRCDGVANFKSVDGTAFNIYLEPDNPDSWKVTQEEYQEDVTEPLGKPEKTVTKTSEVREYVGPVLSVKDELQALRARATQQDAVIAQMVTALRSQGVTIDTTDIKEASS